MLKIGKYELRNNLILAPMAGYTNAEFRRLMAANGAGLTVTEMVSVNALLHGNEKTRRLLKVSQDEQVRCVQLFGANPNDFARAARLDDLRGFDIIDVNMGCPVKKVVCVGAGSALMGDFERAAAIVGALKDCGKTVTVKTRLGINAPNTVLKFAPILQKAGADMIAVHCRTAQQMYSGAADYGAICNLKKILKIPLVINGDIVDSASLAAAKATGADGFMIGRGALFNPMIFSQLLGNPVSKQLKCKVIMLLVEGMANELGGECAAKELRKFIPYMLKDFTTRARRHSLNSITDIEQLKKQLEDIFN